MRVTIMRNIETFPWKQMYPYLSLVERKVAEFYHNIDRRSWLVCVKMTYFHRFFQTIPGVLVLRKIKTRHTLKKAILNPPLWNFSENSSDLVVASFPKWNKFYSIVLPWNWYNSIANMSLTWVIYLMLLQGPEVEIWRRGISLKR